MKQETLEEVCDKVLNYLYPNCKKEMSNLQYTNSINSLKSIAKWQQEPEQFFNDDRVKTLEKEIEYLLKKQEQDKNKYSEEEVLVIIDDLFRQYANSFRIDAKEHFLQFKNK
jgi:hypothetical protein